MYHPKEESESVKWEDTRPIPKKARTAEELGREFLQKHKLDDVDIENHYQIRTLPGPDGMDVNTVRSLLTSPCTNFISLSARGFIRTWSRYAASTDMASRIQTS